MHRYDEVAGLLLEVTATGVEALEQIEAELIAGNFEVAGGLLFDLQIAIGSAEESYRAIPLAVGAERAKSLGESLQDHIESVLSGCRYSEREQALAQLQSGLLPGYQEWKKEIESMLKRNNPMKLHLGCGRNILEGWINLDLVKLDGVDVVADLDDCRNMPLPFENDSIDEFLASHVIEHLANPLPFMEELHRIARPDARAVFRLPYGSSDDTWEDPTHIRPYFLNSFGYFSQPFYWRADYGYRGDWLTEKVSLSVDGKRFAGKTVEEIKFAIDSYRNVVTEMVVELRAIKPIREPKRELIKMPALHIKLTQ